MHPSKACVPYKHELTYIARVESDVRITFGDMHISHLQMHSLHHTILYIIYDQLKLIHNN
jgi:hypothetical protein